MFVRAQRSGKRIYLLVVENEWAAGKVRQKVLHRLGRLDVLPVVLAPAAAGKRQANLML